MPNELPEKVKPILREVQGIGEDDEPKRKFTYENQNWVIDEVDTYNRNLQLNEDESPFVAGYDPEQPRKYIMLKAFLVETWV